MALYEPELPDDMMPYACCDVNSRGVTYANGMIFVGRLDGQLVALDAKTGEEKRKTKEKVSVLLPFYGCWACSTDLQAPTASLR